MKKTMAVLTLFFCLLFMSFAVNGAASEKTTTIEINENNWQDYFEVISRTVCHYNAFDEIDFVQLRYYLALKEEYQENVASDKENSVAFEIESDSAWYYCRFDEEKKEIILAEFKENSSIGRISAMGTIRYQTAYMSDIETVQADISACLFEEQGYMIANDAFGTEGFAVRVPDNIEMIRIQGKISLAGEYEQNTSPDVAAANTSFDQKSDPGTSATKNSL